jgi:hypothetical protein
MPTVFIITVCMLGLMIYLSCCTGCRNDKSCKPADTDATTDTTTADTAEADTFYRTCGSSEVPPEKDWYEDTQEEDEPAITVKTAKKKNTTEAVKPVKVKISRPVSQSDSSYVSVTVKTEDWIVELSKGKKGKTKSDTTNIP